MYKLQNLSINTVKHISEGFTLAEVLVTLLIIGVVASTVIPALINDTQDAQYKVAYKKAFAVASQAWNTAVSNNEIVSTTGMNFTTALNNFTAFENYFKIIRNCPSGSDNSICWATGELFGGWPDTSTSSFIDSSGMSWTLAIGAWNYILVDTNGLKIPNKYGKDRFIFLCETSSGTGDGLPVKLNVYQDFPNIHNVWCPSGGCYYRSWLSN